MSTKEKILAAALRLFNEQGIDAVTTRTIANDLNMSHGNLCYHFPRKEAIIEALYYELVNELSAEINTTEAAITNELEQLYTGFRRTFAIQYKYKFILLHMVEIMRRVESIKLHFKALFKQRKLQFRAIFSGLTEAGIMKTEPYTGYYEVLLNQVYIIGDFWISEAEILWEGNEKEAIKFYSNTALALLYPHLTPKGQQQYHEALKINL